MSFSFKGLIAAGLVGSLAGCTGSTDPETASLFDNIKNLNSGEYDRQIAEKDREAQAIIANNQASQRRIASKERQVSSNAGEISGLRSRLSQVKAQAAAARVKVASDPAKAQRLNALEAQLSGIQSDVNSGAVSAATRSELNRVSSAISALTS